MKKPICIAVAVLYCLIGCSKNTDNKASQSNEESNAKPELKEAITKKPQSNENSESNATPGLKEAMAKKPVNLAEIRLLLKGDLEVDPDTLEPYSGRVFVLHPPPHERTIGIEYLLLNGKRYGLVTSYYEDGSKEKEGFFKENKQHGLMIDYREDGTKKHEINFKEGKKHGVMIVYREDGTKEYEIHYKEGKQNGLTVVYRKDGTKSGEGYFKEGIRHGLATSYRKDGTKEKECQITDGNEDWCKEF